MTGRSQGHLNVVLRGPTPQFFNVRPTLFPAALWIAHPAHTAAPSCQPRLQVRDGPYFPTLKLLHMCTPTPR